MRHVVLLILTWYLSHQSIIIPALTLSMGASMILSLRIPCTVWSMRVHQCQNATHWNFQVSCQTRMLAWSSSWDRDRSDQRMPAACTCLAQDLYSREERIFIRAAMHTIKVIVLDYEYLVQLPEYTHLSLVRRSRVFPCLQLATSPILVYSSIGLKFSAN